MIRFETINEAGKELAGRIAQAHIPFEGDAIVFVGALGICVRKILPLVNDKYTDPAVVCVDSTGRYVIPVLSGHVGGANELARQIAQVTGGEAVITTQSDNMGLWALDTLARRFHWHLLKPDRQQMNHAIATFVNCKTTALLLDVKDEGTRYLTETLPSHVTLLTDMSAYHAGAYELLIIVSPHRYDLPSGECVLQYVPQCLHAGMGLAHQASPVDDILTEVFATVERAGYHREAIADFGTIDVKRDEPVVQALAEQGYPIRFYTAEELSAIEVPTPSETVARHVGTPSVSEAAALKMGGSLVLAKQKGSQWTLALSLSSEGSQEGHIEIVGAGPGDPDLVSVRGRRFLETADLILYAGSLVPRELTLCAKAGATVRSSADMDLEEQFQLMKDFYDRGKLVVRLHTGDPCIYGAIQEQMAFFDRYGMHYHITPGISSFLAAAAELRSQFTIPERCQTIILTRGEGRTPMPDKEKLHLLAAHQSTMCIFLSASIVDEVQQQLLEGGYPPETPVAACYKLTWKEQRIFRGQLKDLSKILKENHLKLTTMIVVGEAIDNRNGLSKLYDGHFTHLFREAKK